MNKLSADELHARLQADRNGPAIDRKNRADSSVRSKFACKRSAGFDPTNAVEGRGSAAV